MTYLGDGARSAVLLPAAQRRELGVGAMTASIVADGDATQGRYSCYRIDLAPRAGGANPHFHRTFAESFHVLEGEVELYDGRAWAAGVVGDHLFIPPGGIHGFRNAADAPASMLMLSAPAVPREAYFAELAEVAAAGRRLSQAEWDELFARHDQYMVAETAGP